MGFLSFDEGENHLFNSDVSGATWYFLLSERSCPADVNNPVVGEHGGGDTLAGGVGEVAYWTGGGRISQVVPAPTFGNLVFALVSFDTGAQTDGPGSVKSVVLVTSVDDTGVAVCAQDVDEGAAVNFAAAGVILDFQLTYFLRNVGET